MPFRTSSLFLLSLALLLSLVQGAFQYAPVLNSFAKVEGTGSYDAAAKLCGDAGAYLGTEPTSALHEAHAQLGGSKSGGTWYAFIGGDTTTPEAQANACAPSVLESTSVNLPTSAMENCYYRWNTGRWREYTDDSASIGTYNNIYRNGIAFRRGSYFTADTTMLDVGCSPVLCYDVNGFPSYFPVVTAGDAQATLLTARPGPDHGHYVVLVGSGATASWSDNEAAGGYSYAAITATANAVAPGGYAISFGDYTSTMPNFIAVCDAQAPSRVMLEPYKDPHSNSNLVWWVIFLIVLFVVCLIAFIIIACCQERENEEEPPEDAPQWAQQEANEVQRTKRYVSQKNFANNGEDKYEDANTGSSFRSGTSATSGGSGSSAASDDESVTNDGSRV